MLLPIGVYLVGFLIARFSKRRQRLGDHLAHTIVVTLSAARTGRLVAVAMLLLVAVVAGFGTSAVRRAATGAGVRDASSGEAPTTDAAGGSLRLERLRWVDREGGAERPSGPYHAGDNVYASYELLGAKTDSQARNDVALSLSVIDPSGSPLAAPWQVNVKAANSSRLPITGNFHVHLPPFVPPGTYALRINAHDAVASRDATFSPTFVVEGTPIPAATALQVRDLRLSATEDGEALTPPVFRPGQTVYFALRLFGVQFRDDRPDLHIDLRLLSPTGEALLSKSDWVAERDSLSYHPAFMFYPLNSYVTLPSGIPKGSYTQEFAIRDGVANASIVFPARFEVR
ncbi:MAG: hypothetical protein ACR2OG_07410 [Gemmatimonadaceae bacterium]